MTNEQTIELLSEMRSRYNCFDESERQFYEALSVAIEALSCSEKPNELQPPGQGQWDGGMIYRQDAIEAIRKLPNAGIHWFVSAEAVFDALLKLPSVTKLEAKELQDVKVERDYWKQRAKYAKRIKGEWIDLDEYQTMDWMSKNKCSICGKITFGELKNYCPNCGADMRGKG